jgi:hypothetical protein
MTAADGSWVEAIRQWFSESLLVLPSTERGPVGRYHDDESQIQELWDQVKLIDPNEVDGRHH